MSDEGLSPPETAIGEVATQSESREVSTSTKELGEVLEKANPEPGYRPDRDRQSRVLSNLPENLVEQLRGHLYAAYKEDQFFREKRGEKGKEFDDRSVLAGELFEMLVEADGQLNQRSPLSGEFLALLHDPRRFNLGEELGHLRNPDLATFRENKLVISSVGEAKLGLLDYRAYQQLQSGFKRGLAETVNVLNDLGDIKNHGLVEVDSIRRQGNKLGVDEKFKEVLVVPAHRQTERVRSLINRADFFHSREYYRFVRILSDEELIEIKKAAFSAAEVHALVDYLLPKIVEGDRPEPITT